MQPWRHVSILMFISVMLLAGVLLLAGSGSLAASPNAPAACVPGPHSGHIAADETWCLADSPHQVTGEGVIVDAGVTLTIEPGVTVKGRDWNTFLTVHGQLQALGTATDPIIFTSEADSDHNQWGGLYLTAALAICSTSWCAMLAMRTRALTSP